MALRVDGSVERKCWPARGAQGQRGEVRGFVTFLTVTAKERTMKAILYHEYGSPDVLELKDIDKPLVKDNEVLVRVHAASVNRLDWHLMRGSPYISRLQAGLRRPKDRVLGADVTGKVEAVGRHVTKFQPGDAVFGSLFGHRFGALLNTSLSRMTSWS
jgi:hypothetical protein